MRGRQLTAALWGLLSKALEAATRRAIAETGCPSPLAIVRTSSKAKVGRGDVWRLMREVVMQD